MTYPNKVSRKCYGRNFVSAQNVPVRVGVKLEKFDEDDELNENWPFRELVGNLMLLAISTRPDISNAVRSVARYCSAPKAIHRKAALGILANINGNSGFGITYQRGTLSCARKSASHAGPYQTGGRGTVPRKLRRWPTLGG